MNTSTISKEHLGLAAEFAVASELCRRNIYAQLTLGARKRTDLLIDSGATMVRVEVKAKQGNSWPNCKGIPRHGAILVLVDYAKKEENERPDFYVLTGDDWLHLVNQECNDGISRGEIVVDSDGTPVWIRQVKNGRPYKGMGIGVSQVKDYTERWDKIELLLKGSQL